MKFHLIILETRGAYSEFPEGIETMLDLLKDHVVNSMREVTVHLAGYCNRCKE